MTDEQIADLVTRERREQGLPDRITDPVALAKVVEWLRAGEVSR